MTAASDVPAAFPHALHTFVELFNARAYWESHEVLEGPWRAHGSAFYKGLILYASAFVHLGSANAHGVRAQLDKAARELAPFAPGYLGIDVRGVLEFAAGVRDVAAEAEAAAGASAPASPPCAAAEAWAFGVRVPPLRLDPTLLRGDEPELTAG